MIINKGLRSGIHEFLQAGEALRHRNDDVYIYNHVKGAGAGYPRYGSRAFVWLQFSIPRMQTKTIRWDISKRFMNDSLLCLSPTTSAERFKTCIFVTVAERDLQQLARGKVGVRFVDQQQMEAFDWEQEYDMVESTCFFGAVSPVLSSLQKIKNYGILCSFVSFNSFRLTLCMPPEIPFGPILLTGQSNGQPPAYIQGQTLLLDCLYPQRAMQKRYLCNGISFFLCFKATTLIYSQT